MKTMKKLMAVLLTMAMLLSMSVVTMAATTTTGTITMTGSNDNHTYQIYQILTGDYDTTTGKLSNVYWGSATDKSGTKATETELNTISALADNSTVTSDTIFGYIKNDATATATITGNGSATVAAGYYVIKDSDAAISGTDAKTAYIVKVVGNVEVSPKSSVPTVTKKVKDTNDSTGATTDWQDSADYDIGDSIPYQLTGTLPSTYADYKAYFYEFKDTMNNLTYVDGSAKVYAVINGSYYNISKSFNVLWDSTAKTLNIYCIDLKKITISDSVAISSSTKIEVRYSATLDTSAVIGSTGNPNEVTLQFSNNPSEASKGTPDQPTNPNPEYPDNPDSPDNPDNPDTPNVPTTPDEPTKPETGDTTPDKNVVFTYKTVVDKYANSVAEGNELEGAEFTLSKVNADTTTTVVKTYTVTKNTAGTEFTFIGLDDGTYVLTETTTPAGYNTIDPITFTVTAEHDATADTPALTNLTGNVVSGEATFTATAANGTLSTDVVNKSGSTLPTTGGIGTTIFYVLGTILVLGAGVVLVARRRIAR